MDYERMANIYNYVYSTPANSQERVARLAELSEEDNAALYDYSVGLLSGRIKKAEVKETMVDGTKTYEWYKKKMESDKSGTMQEVSQFAMKCPELYAQYRERRQQPNAFLTVCINGNLFLKQSLKHDIV